MMELPEAVTLARQIHGTLTDRRIASAERESHPHRWVFYNRPREDYERVLLGRRIGAAEAEGNHVNVGLDGGYALQVGDGGLRVRLHPGGAGVPAKRHLLLAFEDGDVLTVVVRGWGAVRLLDEEELSLWRAEERIGIPPPDEAFTYEHFRSILAAYATGLDRSVKAFLVNRPKMRGVGNGYLQDILFAARLHPRRKVRDIAPAERRRLFLALRRVLKEAIAKGGRTDEPDLLGRPGGYARVLGRHAAGAPCPACGALIEKIHYLGGSCYLCPSCQPEV